MSYANMICQSDCGKQTLRGSPNIFHFLVVMALYNLIPFYNLILTNRIQQTLRDVTSMIRLQKIVTSVLLADSQYCHLRLYNLINKVSTWKISTQYGLQTIVSW